MTRTRLDRTLWPAFLALIATLALFEATNLDLLLQDRLFDFGTGRWRIDGNAAGPRVLFYTGPKFVIIAIGVGALVYALCPSRWRARLGLDARRRRALFVVVGTLATGPALVGIGKAVTNVFCPSEVRRYGGDVPYVTLCSPFSREEAPARRGHCFPAGHASGGFALVSLAGLTRRPRRAALLLAGGLAVGWTMGIYQMAKGAHYLSHTIVTMLVVWIVFLLWRRLVGGLREKRFVPAASPRMETA